MLNLNMKKRGMARPCAAADFSLFAQVERLVGTMGDAAMGAAVPELLAEGGLWRLWEWREGMLALHPISYRGKPVPGARLRGGGWAGQADAGGQAPGQE